MSEPAPSLSVLSDTSGPIDLACHFKPRHAVLQPARTIARQPELFMYRDDLLQFQVQFRSTPLARSQHELSQTDRVAQQLRRLVKLSPDQLGLRA